MQSTKSYMNNALDIAGHFAILPLASSHTFQWIDSIDERAYQVNGKMPVGQKAATLVGTSMGLLGAGALAITAAAGIMVEPMTTAAILTGTHGISYYLTHKK